MLFLGNNYSLGIIIFMHVHFQFSFSNHYISIRISRAPSLRACSSLIVISTKLYRAGTWPVGAPPLAHPHPAPRPSSLLVRERCCVFESAKLASELSSEAGLWPLRFPRPGAWGCASRENRVEPVAFATLTQVGRVSLSARVSSSSPGSLSRALTCIVCEPDSIF